MLDLKKAKQVAEQAALKAGQFIKQNQDKVEIKTYKDRQDIVTNIDLEAEKIIIQQIEQTYPQHNIFAEEAGKIDKKSPYTWVIDPLDGTKEYVRGQSLYQTSISLESTDQLLVGCNYVPETNELFSAAFGIGSFENSSHKISISKQNKLNHSIIVCHPPNFKLKEPEYSQYWQLLANLAKQSYRLRPMCYDNWALCHLAKGAYEAYFVLFDQGPKWWDLAAGLIIAQEAGATVTDRFGKPIKPGGLSNGIVITNGLIHQQLLKIINQ